MPSQYLEITMVGNNWRMLGASPNMAIIVYLHFQI